MAGPTNILPSQVPRFIIVTNDEICDRPLYSLRRKGETFSDLFLGLKNKLRTK
jgi:hypothetical protein